MNSNLRIAQSTDRDITTLVMTGELDEAGCPALDACLAEHCHPGARIVVDLRALNFVDSAGVELLHRTSVRSKLEGWAFAVRTTGGRYLSSRRAAA
jgi:anti-anti-sigma factor